MRLGGQCANKGRGGGRVRDLHQNPVAANVHIGPVVQEHGGQEADKREEGEHAQRVRQNGVATRQDAVHVCGWMADTG